MKISKTLWSGKTIFCSKPRNRITLDNRPYVYHRLNRKTFGTSLKLIQELGRTLKTSNGSFKNEIWRITG